MRFYHSFYRQSGQSLADIALDMPRVTMEDRAIQG